MRLVYPFVVLILSLTSCNPWKSSGDEVSEEIRKANREFYVSVFENGNESGPERMIRHQKLVAAAEKASGTGGAIFRIGLKTFGEILPDFIRAEEMERHLLEMQDLESLAQKKNFAERRRFFQDFRKATKDVNVFLQNTMQERIKLQLDEARIVGSQRDHLEARYINDLHESGKEWLIVRQSNFEIAGLMLEMIDLLETQDGHWTLDEERRVIISDEVARRNFVNLSEKLNSVSRKRSEAYSEDLKAWTR